MSMRSATSMDSATLDDRKESVATQERKPRKGRRSASTGGAGAPNPFGLEPVGSFELKLMIRKCRMDCLYRDDNPYKVEHTGQSLSCIRNKEFSVPNEAAVHVYELPVGKTVRHLDLIEALGLDAVLSSPLVIDACLRRPEFLAERGRGDDDIVTNFFYHQNEKGHLVAVCVERCGSGWCLRAESMYARHDVRRAAQGRCRIIVCGELS